ncbi:MAG: glycosyl hydrolase 53 family protein [Bacteroidales bacterium]|nr:glycosyl hydrolase 53 family protein [Bacteroidales bacterium]
MSIDGFRKDFPDQKRPQYTLTPGFGLLLHPMNPINPAFLPQQWLRISVLALFLAFSACSKSDKPEPPTNTGLPVRAIDASLLGQVRQSGVAVYNAEGIQEDMLLTLKHAGVNTIRLRVWNHPADGHCSPEEVKSLSAEIKSLGMKVWLSVHYSDTWADPGQQTKPLLWQNLSFNQLKDSVYWFTKGLVTAIQPDYIQIGNEINNGLLWPDGQAAHSVQMLEMLAEGARAVRESNATTRILIHYAGQDKAIDFLDRIKLLDYDILGLSYYPLWHGRNTDSLQMQLNSIASIVNKDVVIAETSYPFSLGWNDWTNNVIGDTSQLIPSYPPTPQGQLDFLEKIRSMITHTPKGIGFCYWGGEWISFKGSQATNGSTWENQALWDFGNKALPALDAFRP